MPRMQPVFNIQGGVPDMDKVFIDNYASLLGKRSIELKRHSLDDTDSLALILVAHGPLSERGNQYPETGDP